MDLDYAFNLTVLDEHVSEKNEFVKILRVHGADTALKINTKKTQSLRLTII